MSAELSLKEKVKIHIAPIVTKAQLKDHKVHTDDTLVSQKEFLKRVVVEDSPDPLSEVDSIRVIGTLNEDSICPFIKGHMAKDP